jgi:phage baseplate assembly protein W
LFISIYRKSITMNSYNITFPFKDDNEIKTYFQMNNVTKDSYSSNLLLLLLTQKGERYYESDYGTNLIKYIFEPNDNVTSQEIEEEIRNTVSLYIPEVKITSVTFNWNNDEEGNPTSENQLNVNVKFIYTEGSLNEEGNIDLNF